MGALGSFLNTCFCLLAPLNTEYLSIRNRGPCQEMLVKATNKQKIV